MRKITLLFSEIKLKGKQILKKVTAEAALFFNESLVKHTHHLYSKIKHLVHHLLQN